MKKELLRNITRINSPAAQNPSSSGASRPLPALEGAEESEKS